MSSMKKSNLVHPDNVPKSGFAGGGGSPGYNVILKQPQASATAVSFCDGEYYDHSRSNVNNMNNFDTSSNNVSPNPSYQGKSASKQPIPSDCPKGLEPLVNLEHLFIKQSHLVTEFFLDAANKFEILDSDGSFVFLAAETTQPLTRIFCFGGYPFELMVNSLPGNSTYSWNAKGKEVLKLSGSCGSCGCGGEVTVTMGKKTLGSIEQEGDCTRPSYSVRNTENKVVLIIQGPDKPHCFSCGFGNNLLIPSSPSSAESNHHQQQELIKFEILLPESRVQVGRIARQHVLPPGQQFQPAGVGGGGRSTNSYYNNSLGLGGANTNRQQEFKTARRASVQHLQRRESVPPVQIITRTREHELWGLKFPLDLDPSTKGLLLSAVYLLEYQYYNV